MHVSTKETDDAGIHILTNLMEADGPGSLASADAKIAAKVISVERTESGGVKVQTAVEISEPAPAKPAAPQPPASPEEQATSYLAAKGFSAKEAKASIEKFGAARILAAKAKEDAEQEAQLDAELLKTLAVK